MSNLPVIANRYQIEREIGRGGAGVVYAVKHVHTGERLAMKVLLSHAANQPDIVQRFRREMQASARVRSEHVVRITDADIAPELDGAPFLVMELLNGADLSKLVVERGACPKEEAIWILGQAARGLDRAHAAGIVHRDLKPENLFMHVCDDQRLVIKILDFGIARMSEGVGMPAAQARMTQDGAILGTPLFLTPEQALGEIEKIGAGTDVWTIGLIACELLTGTSYWSDEQMTTLLAKIIFKKLLPPSEKGVKLGPGFDEWFLRSCAREPTDRWPSVGVQIEALADALQIDRSYLTMTEPPAALRAWLEARMKRGARISNQPPEMNLATLTEVARPVRTSATMPQVSAVTPKNQIQIIDPQAQRSSEAVQPAVVPKSRRRILATMVSSGVIVLALGLGGILLLRQRGGATDKPVVEKVGVDKPTVDKPGPPDRAEPLRVPPTGPSLVQAPSGPPATPPGESPDPTEPGEDAGKGRRGSHGKAAGARPHGKKQRPPDAHTPAAYDPSAP